MASVDDIRLQENYLVYVYLLILFVFGVNFNYYIQIDWIGGIRDTSRC